ncbi:MAG: hypothetical protein FWG10_00515 [Eubacteriaceae bacterium]|nr:hypothetical protein [Eubacteriaceae bacterium]
MIAVPAGSSASLGGSKAELFYMPPAINTSTPVSLYTDLAIYKRDNAVLPANMLPRAPKSS